MAPASAACCGRPAFAAVAAPFARSRFDGAPAAQRRPASTAARAVRRPCAAVPVAVLPPRSAGRFEVPLTDEERGPEGYEWDASFPGTLRPGVRQDDCFPLDGVLRSGVYDRMVYEELDFYDRSPVIHEPDDDLLDWLARNNRLIPKDMNDAELEIETDKQTDGITEEDLEFGDDEDRMLQYYSKQGEGSAMGASPDFGGIAESGLEGSFDQ